MDVIESIKKDKAYLKCKLVVKTWERDFKTKNSRTPSKFDIKEAPAKIKYAYKKYFQLKSAALENSVSICDIDEDFNVSPESVRLSDNASFNLTLSPHHSEIADTIPNLPSGQEIEQLLSNTSKQLNIEKLHPFTENLSKKLFHNRRFALRNPRKLSAPKTPSLSENKISTNKESNKNDCTVAILDQLDVGGELISNNESISEEHILLPEHLSFSVDCKKSPNVRQLNKAWLERASGVTTEDAELIKCSNETEKFGIRNIIVQNFNEKPCDYVENSDSEDDKVINKLKPALKKRKINKSTVEDRHNASISEYNELNVKKVLKVHQSKQSSEKSKTRSKTKTIKNNDNSEAQQPPDIKEYVPFGLENDILPRHTKLSNLQPINIASKSDKSNKDVDSREINKLENKIKQGTLNDNFVKINIEKKIFVRGKKGINFSKYKKQQWKNKKALHASMEFPESGKISCFKCGQAGHMARYCTSHRGEALLPLESYNENDIPTLDDMQKFVFEETDNSKSLSEQLSIVYEPSEIPESFLKMLESSNNYCSTDVKPVYSNYEQALNENLYEFLHKFGHKSFRPGQEHTIKRILCGMSTLLILSTGGGKSLCYQLPAYIYSQHFKCITLVISPLVSLMEDQVLNMPDFLKAGCLHTNQPPTQRRKIIQCLKDGEIKILLISPEALISGDTSNGFTGLFKSLPQIAFACIDEAHCVSQWSHNFRPSYLMICRVLREKLNVKCILGLTATATQTTIKSIISHLNVPDGLSGVITNPTLPDNLHLSVTFEKDKDRGLVAFLSSERVNSFNSIIVYCIRRDECERVAAILRSCLQETGKINMEKQSKKRKRMSYIAEAYHAGMSAAQRRKIQKHFMDGTLKIIVATVAFGMGINKSDIRCIIHYNMPSSFESYVQEVGRAGRDGQPALCHVLMNNSDNDKNELLKHIHANSIDRPTIRKLLQRVFIPCECHSSQGTSVSQFSRNCNGHEVGIPIDITVEELDLPAENIATLLCYVELHPKHYIKVLNNAYTMCKISSYGGPQKMLEAAKSCRPLAMAILLESKKDPNITNKSVIEFNVVEIAAAIGWESGMTKYQLKNLEWIIETGTSKRSHLKVEFNTLGFRIKARGDLTSTELDSILDDLHETVLNQEKTRLYQLEECNNAFKQLGNNATSNSTFTEDNLLTKSNELKHAIRNYFQRNTSLPEHIALAERPLDVDRLASDVKSLISSYKDCTFTGRSIARIFQGISSPNFPAIVWGRCKFWRAHLHEDFNGIVKIATQQIIQMKM